MSAETNEDRQRRYEAMVQKVHANNSTSTTIMPSGSVMASVSTYAPSESCVFKMPNTMKTQMEWARIETAVNIFTNAFRTNPDIDKFFKKLWVRMSNEILLLSQQHLLGTVDEVAILDVLINALKTKFYSGRIPRSISLQSQTQSEITQCDPFGTSMNMAIDSANRPYNFAGHPGLAGNFNTYPMQVERLQQENQSQMSAMNMNPSVMLDRTTSSYQPQIFAQNNNISVMMNHPLGRSSSSHQTTAQNNNVSVVQEKNTRLQPSAQNNSTSVLKENRTSTRLQSSVIQKVQRNKSSQCPKISLDKTQKAAVAKGTEVNRTVRKARNSNESLQGGRALQQRVVDTTDNISVVGCRGVTRSGRQVKSPNEFWKGIESKLQEPSIIDYGSRKLASSKLSNSQDLNETLTLRNKVVVKNTPVQKKSGSAKNKPMATIDEQEHEVKKKPVRAKRDDVKKSINKDNKENEKKVASKTNQQVKKVDPKPKAVKKAPTKRKTKDNTLIISKRKKIEECLSDTNSLNSDSDELFEAIFHKKRPQTVNQVLSPSNGLQSVKKAAAAATSKETPPAKFISQLMEPEFAAPTPAKNLPESKVSQVVKRVSKIVERKVPVKATKKTKPEDSNREESTIVDQIYDDIVKATYTTATPSGNVGLTVLRGTELASDDDELSEDEDNDDLF